MTADRQAWVLLEVNARPWGSMPLPVGLGVDFPYRWYRLLVDGQDTPPISYPIGIFGRNLVPDLWNTLADAKQLRAKGGSLPRFTANRISELGRVFTGREIHDVLVRDDLKPGLLELWSIAEKVGGYVARKLPVPAHARRMLAHDSLKKALNAAPRGEVRAVFVCQGNICRSPFAEAMLRSRLTARSGPVTVASFGMMPRPGRPTPDLGVAVAESKGIDLRGHRSAHFSRDETLAATVIFIFDEINRRAILDRYPDLRVPILRLGDFAPRPAGDIEDPIDGGRDVYQAVYDTIEASVNGVVELLNARPRRP